MRVLPVPGGSERKDRNEPGRSKTGSVRFGRWNLPLIERRAEADVGNVPPAVTVVDMTRI